MLTPFLRSTVFFALLLFGTSLTVFAQTTVSIPCDRDNSIFSASPQNSNGIGVEVYTGRTNDTFNMFVNRAFLHFPISDSVPQNATILDVTLELYCTKVANTGTSAFYDLVRVTSDWGEAGSLSLNGQGVAADTNDATWATRFFPTDAWSNPGGDLSPVQSASLEVTTANQSYQWTSSQLVGDTKDMLVSGASNFGWCLKGADENAVGTGRAFASRENTTVSSSQLPRLIVTYQDNSTGIFSPDLKPSISIYPNPGKEMLVLSAMPTEVGTQYQMLTAEGRVVNSGRLTSTDQEIRTAELPVGVYFIRFPDSGIAPVKWLKF